MDKPNTVLIVDDSKENINALRGTLDDKYAIRVALNGEMALKALAQTKVDLVLLDVVMPEMDGFEVLEKMRADEKLKNIPVVFVTSAQDAYSEARGLLLGAVDYVTKPYNADIVSIKVRNQLENKMYRDMLEHLVDERTLQLSQSRDAIIIGMSLIAEGRDKETGEHIKRIKNMTAIIGNEYLRRYPDAITKEDIKRIVLVSPLHDVGKVSVSDTILLKPGKLTDEEFKMMQNHTVFGANVLRETHSVIQDNTEEIATAIEIAESHHEKYDGTGYPYKLKGEEIPISARIVSLADVFDALTSKRVYKNSIEREDAYKIILEGDGRTAPTHFDPKLLDVFDAVKDDL